MPSLKIIRKRISSVKNTQKITRAMKMVSAAKLRRAQDRAQSSRPYEAELLKIVSGVLSDQEWKSPLTEKRDVSKLAVVVISTDRGLCGSLNSNLFKRVEKYLFENSSKNIEIIALGRKAKEYFKRQSRNVVRVEEDLLKRGDYSFFENLAAELQTGFLKSQFDHVEVFYNEFKSALVQKPEQMTFLPFSPPVIEKTNSGALSSYILEPEAEELLAKMIPLLISFRFYRVVIESFASEHAARMAAMDSATNNAKDMIGRLTLAMNRARQAAITTELMEIIGGAEAISQ